MNYNLKPLLAAACLFGVAASASALADPASITIDVGHPGHAISPTLYGLMTEEINHSYDGGIYAELIQNRAFKDDATNPVHWTLVQDGGGAGQISIDTTNPVNTALSVSLDLSITTPGKRVGVANDGYWGIPVKPNTTYTGSFYAQAQDGFSGPVTVSLESADGSTVYASAVVPAVSTSWAHYGVTLNTGNVQASTNNRLVISGSHAGTLRLSLVSLFPPTYDNRANGNRVDLMEKLAAMKPAFLRLPGGNYLEGDTIAQRFEWKNTIGDISQRAGHRSPWKYQSTDGMGLLEFLDWCEDLHMQPVLAVYAGYSLLGEHVDAGPALQPYVQDALDEIQYVTGDTSTKWGGERAADGHPAPFPLEYVEIGNEDNFDQSGSYPARYAQFYDAIRAAYPKLKIIATVRSGKGNSAASVALGGRTPDVIDDHFYRSASAMEADSTHYDKFDRSGPKVFVGEWATTEGNPTPTMNAALGDAAWMTGLERNSDVVSIASYAPLFVNMNPHAGQWRTNLIGYDAINSFGSPSYYTQCMFSNNLADVVLPTTVTQPPIVADTPHGSVGVSTWNTQAQFKDIVVTDANNNTLYSEDLSGTTIPGSESGGVWSVADGVLSQTSSEKGCRLIMGDPTWTDYTLSLKACKTGGAEGFLILFHVKDKNNFLTWNLGGMGDTKSQFEQRLYGSDGQMGRAVPMTIDTGRWYDIRITVKGTDVQYFLDGTLVSEQRIPPSEPLKAIYATAGRVLKTGDVILKVVNASTLDQPLNISLNGAHSVEPAATLTQISGDPAAVNSLAQPTNIVPTVTTISDASTQFTLKLPPDSVSVLSIKTK